MCLTVKFLTKKIKISLMKEQMRAISVNSFLILH